MFDIIYLHFRHRTKGGKIMTNIIDKRKCDINTYCSGRKHKLITEFKSLPKEKKELFINYFQFLFGRAKERE